MNSSRAARTNLLRRNIVLSISRAPATQMVFNATGQQYRQTTPFPETPKPVGRDRPADPYGVDELQPLHAGAVPPLDLGKSAAPESPDGEIRGSRDSPVRIRDMVPPYEPLQQAPYKTCTGSCFESYEPGASRRTTASSTIRRPPTNQM